MTEKRRMIDAREAAAMLGLSERTVYKMASYREVPSFKFGKAVRFDANDIEAYREQCRQPARAPAGKTTHAPPSAAPLDASTPWLPTKSPLQVYFESRRSKVTRKPGDPAPATAGNKRG